MAKTNTKATPQQIKAAAQQIDLKPVLTLINWDGQAVTYALKLIDAIQGILGMLKIIAPDDLIAGVEGALQNAEDFIKEQQAAAGK